MEQYWPSELISEKARNTTGLVWPLQVSGVCLRLLMVTGGHWRPLDGLHRQRGEAGPESEGGRGPGPVAQKPAGKHAEEDESGGEHLNN